MAFINLYWKDGRSGGFCKHKFNSPCNQAVEVIYSLPRSGHDAWHSLGTSIRIAQASEKGSIESIY